MITLNPISRNILSPLKDAIPSLFKKHVIFKIAALAIGIFVLYLCIKKTKVLNSFKNYITPMLRSEFEKILDSGDKNLLMKYLARAKFNIKLLDLKNFKDLNDADLKSIATFCPLLEILSITHSHQITDNGLKDLQVLSCLQSLFLSECTQITDTGIGYLNPGISHLILEDCQQLTDRGMQHFQNFSFLSVLELSGMQNVTDRGLSYINTDAPLMALRLEGCTQLTNRGLMYLKEFPGLNRLTLNGCPNITDRGFADLFNHINAIEYLRLEACDNITNRNPSEFLSKLTSLNDLIFINCKQISDESIEDFSIFLNATSKISNLKTLYIKNCHQITDKGISDLCLFENLCQLELNECDNIEGFGFKGLPPSMQAITLSSCQKISNVIFSQFKNKSLNDIEIYKCKNITSLACKDFKDDYKGTIKITH